MHPTIPWLPAGDRQHEVFFDFRNVREGLLSVYQVPDDIAPERIAIAIAATRTSLDPVGYAIFDSDPVTAVGVTPHKSAGLTPDDRVNDLHYDLRTITASNLLNIVHAISMGPIEIPTAEFLDLVESGITAGHLDGSRVKTVNKRRR